MPKKGYKQTKEHRKKISLSNKGKQKTPLTEERKRNMSIVLKGHIVTEESREKISIANLGKKNPNWKEDKVGYKALHGWLTKNKPKPKLCELCNKKKPLVLANIRNHVYTRNPNDYRWYCDKCHRKRDASDRFFKNFRVKNINERR